MAVADEMVRRALCVTSAREALRERSCDPAVGGLVANEAEPASGAEGVFDGLANEAGITMHVFISLRSWRSLV